MAEEKETKKQSSATVHGVEKGIGMVNRKPKKGIVSLLVDLLEKWIVKLMFDFTKPQHLIDETPPLQNLPVKGFLPGTSPTKFYGTGSATPTKLYMNIATSQGLHQIPTGAWRELVTGWQDKECSAVMVHK